MNILLSVLAVSLVIAFLGRVIYHYFYPRIDKRHDALLALLWLLGLPWTFIIVYIANKLERECDVCYRLFWFWEPKVHKFPNSMSVYYHDDVVDHTWAKDAYAVCEKCLQFHEKYQEEQEIIKRKQELEERLQKAKEAKRIRPLLRQWLKKAPQLQDSKLLQPDGTPRPRPEYLSFDEVLEKVIDAVVGMSSHAKDNSGLPYKYKEIFTSRYYIDEFHQRYYEYSGSIYILADGRFVIIWEGPWNFTDTCMDYLP